MSTQHARNAFHSREPIAVRIHGWRTGRAVAAEPGRTGLPTAPIGSTGSTVTAPGIAALSGMQDGGVALARLPVPVGRGGFVPLYCTWLPLAWVRFIVLATFPWIFILIMAPAGTRAPASFPGPACSLWRGMNIETVAQDPRWAEIGLGALAERALAAVLSHLNIAPDQVEIGVLGCDDATIAGLNTRFRNRLAATNVLSWPASQLVPPALPDREPDGTLALGDIAIAYETCAREASAAAVPLADHTVHLIVHAVLHLLGYDHIRDTEATVMESLEVQILGKLGIGNPYNG